MVALLGPLQLRPLRAPTPIQAADRAMSFGGQGSRPLSLHRQEVGAREWGWGGLGQGVRLAWLLEAHALMGKLR